MGIEDEETLEKFISLVDGTNRALHDSGVIMRKYKPAGKPERRKQKIKLHVKLSDEARREGLDKVAERTLKGLDRLKIKVKLPPKKLEPLEPEDLPIEDEERLRVYEKCKRAGRRAMRRVGYELGADGASRMLQNIPKEPRKRKNSVGGGDHGR